MLTKLKQRFGSLAGSVVRFPLTAALLAACTVLMCIDIGTGERYTRWTLTLEVGALAAAVAQTAYERFMTRTFWRYLLMLFSLVFGAVFYLSIKNTDMYSAALLIRSAVTLFALFIAFVWVGVIQSRWGFDQSFMAAFKALFQALFFSGILFLGCAAVIAAINLLIVRVDSSAFGYAAIVIFNLIATLIFFSLIPVYPGRAALMPSPDTTDRHEPLIDKRTGSPRFLEILLSYIILPLIAVFTVILIVYILLNIGGRFWTDNLLEPLLISYTAVVITAVLLTGRLENRTAVLFRKIFPKVLIPIALFQVVASSLVLADTGVTYGRYYVILYGVFAVLSGFVLSFLPLRRSGMIAVLFIVFSAVSLIPPVDAFTVSRSSQISTLEKTLLVNGMLQDGAIRPNGSISDRDKTKIVSAVRYLSETRDLGKVSWLPAGFTGYDDDAFYKTFGFHLYQPAQPENPYIRAQIDLGEIIPVLGYDFMTRVMLPYQDSHIQASRTFTVAGTTYTLQAETDNGGQFIIVRDASGKELIRLNVNDIYTRYSAYAPEKSTLSLDEATFTAAGSTMDLKVIVMNVSFSKGTEISNQYADLMILIRLK